MTDPTAATRFGGKAGSDSAPLTTIDRRWPADGTAPRTQARANELVYLGRLSLPLGARVEWMRERKANGGYPCSEDCDACWRSHLFLVGLEVERGRA